MQINFSTALLRPLNKTSFQSYQYAESQLDHVMSLWGAVHVQINFSRVGSPKFLHTFL